MRACHIVDIKTPRKFLLRGFWFGARRPKCAFVFVHGLGGSGLRTVDLEFAKIFSDKKTACLTFNNRGHDKISRLHREKPRSRKGYASFMAGAAHEVFTECADDIQGAINVARRAGAREIYLVGHSTGCQKSVYWAHKKDRGLSAQAGVKGVILLAPLSDYADAVKQHGKRRLTRIATVAQRLVRRGEKHELLPTSLWPHTDDAQRFLSLYTADSIEQSIFTYFDTKRSPRMLRKIRIPTLVLLAEKDEYGDRPAKKIAEWFAKHVQARKSLVRIVPKAPHSFKGGERIVAREMRKWMETL